MTHAESALFKMRRWLDLYSDTGNILYLFAAEIQAARWRILRGIEPGNARILEATKVHGIE